MKSPYFGQNKSSGHCEQESLISEPDMLPGDYRVFKFSVVIVRTMCDIWRTIKSVTFVMDEHNVVSLWSVEDPTNLVEV